MNSRIRIAKDHLIISKMFFYSQKYINQKKIKSVEIYGKSVIPPLVFSIFLLCVQLLLFNFGKKDIERARSIILLINIPIIFCLVITIFRLKYLTMKMTTYDYPKTLVLHFISRSQAEKIAKDIHRIMND